MISKNFYIEKIREVSKLLNNPIRKELAEAIYNKISDHYEDDDLSKSIDDILLEGKFDYPTLLKSLQKYSSIRIENELNKQKQKEIEEIRYFFNKNHISSIDCRDKDCGNCKKMYCDILASNCLNLIKRLLKGEINSDSMFEYLSQFKGIGFDEFRKVR